MSFLNRYNLLLIGYSLLVLTGCNSRETSCAPFANLKSPIITFDYPKKISKGVYWPSDEWQKGIIVSPNGCVLFENLSKQISRELPFVNSFMVVYRGYNVYEDFFNGLQPDDLQLQQSVAKSITSALVGIALYREEIPSLDLSIGEVLPKYFASNQSSISPHISIRDALSMRSGIEFDVLNLMGKFEDYKEYNVYIDNQLQGQLISDILSAHQAYEPGTVWQYSTADTQIVSTMFQELVGQSLSEYANQNLFEPLGIKNYIWRHDGDGVTVGGGLLWLRPVDMAKFGFLFLKNGYWDGNPIVPEEWVQASTQPQGKAVNTKSKANGPITNYGYQWWLLEPGFGSIPNGAFQALGYGGQMILIIPDIDTVIVATSNSLVSSQESYEQQRILTRFVDQSVIRELTLLKELP